MQVIGKKYGAEGGVISILGGSSETGMGDITSNIISYNKAISNTSNAYGGFLSNDGIFGNITGNMIGNAVLGAQTANGGAIHNMETIGSITGNFIANYAQASNSFAYGGAIDNSHATIGDITGDFIGNYAFSSASDAGGGAIAGLGTIGNITGDFLSNYAEIASETKKVEGGAVRTASNMTFTSGAKTHFFSDNYTKDPTRGKIYNAVFSYKAYYSNTPIVTFEDRKSTRLNSSHE